MSPGPIFRRELGASARGRRLYWARVVAASAIAAYVGSRPELLRGWSGDAALSAGEIARNASRAFEAFGDAQLVGVLAMVPALVAGSVAGESARGTLGLLLASRIGAAEVVGGKLVAGLLVVGVLILAGLPVVALFGMLGGVDPARALASYGGTVAAAWFVAAVAMLVSVHARSAAEAVAGAYAALLGWIVLPIWLVGWLGPPGTPSPVAWFGPIAREVARSSPLSVRFPMEVWGRWATVPAGWSWMVGETAALQASFGFALFALAAQAGLPGPARREAVAGPGVARAGGGAPGAGPAPLRRRPDRVEGGPRPRVGRDGPAGRPDRARDLDTDDDRAIPVWHAAPQLCNG